MHTALANQLKGPCKTIWVIRTLRIIKPFALSVRDNLKKELDLLEAYEILS